MAKARKKRDLNKSQKQPEKRERTPFDYEKHRQSSQKMDRKEYEKMLAKQSIAKRNQKRRKTRKSFISIFLVLIALIICGFVCVVVFFKINTINFDIPEDMNKDEVLSYCTFTQGENIINANTTGSIEKLFNKYDNIDQIVIEKKYPSTVKITINKAIGEFIAKDKNSDTYALISTNGRIIQTAKNLTEIQDNDKIIIRGIKQTFEKGEFIKNNEKDFENCKKITDAFIKAEIGNVKQIDINDEFNINILINDKIKISIGNILSIEYKLKMAKSAKEKDFLEDDYGVIDVSNEGSAYIRKGKDYIASFFDPVEDEVISSQTSQEISFENTSIQ